MEDRFGSHIGGGPTRLRALGEHAGRSHADIPLHWAVERRGVRPRHEQEDLHGSSIRTEKNIKEAR